VAGVIGSRAEQLRDVGVAAHHPVQDDDVGRLDRARVHRDVDQATLHPIADAGHLDQGRGLGLVAGRELQIGR
jgi:hypothetical protein